MTNVSSQFHILNESFGRIKSDPEAVFYLLCTLSLFSVSFDGTLFIFLFLFFIFMIIIVVLTNNL